MTTCTHVKRIALKRNPHWEWQASCVFTDREGRMRATWQLVPANRDQHGAVYEAQFRDGIPLEESAPAEFGEHTRLSLRDEITRHERDRIGAY